MASAPSLSPDAQLELIRSLLSDHEQSLLRLSSNGKSPAAIAQLYRQYEGENGVKDALAAIGRKLERGATRRMEMASGGGGPLVRKVLDAAGVEEMPPRPSGSNGRMREPARPAEPRARETPPNGAAPAPVPASPPESSPAPVASPAPLQRKRSSAGIRSKVLELVGEYGPVTRTQIEGLSSFSKSSVTRSLAELAEDGAIALAGTRHTGTSGAPAKVWDLAERVEAAPPTADGHAAEAPEFPPRFAEGSFDAQVLWDSLSPERRKLLARLVLREAVFPAISGLLLG